ncbi:unnamed protein product [Orchesella dallaii]|uniref:C3H1-type domain-containing protein n=1 Tax=Orchesella dallaii TaxID=48710 RepID=A0ABP1PM74_9HEXA
MPPKPAPKAQGPSKKTEQKKKEKVIEDKTFGLKNKKGGKQQKFIQQVQKQVQFGGNPSSRKLDLAKEAEKAAKKVPDPKDEIMGQIFKPVQKVEKGADPKSILCAFFKQGQCGKGDKCKFSHDLMVERKAEKRSLYCDMREGEDAEGDTMENWDEEKLKEVVAKKHGNEGTKEMPKTDIICKFFLDAVEKNKYGWFWQCPNGENCHYRHALPPGFILKRDAKKLAEESKKLRDEVSLEDLIERERAALSSQNLTKVTLESFMMWKKRKLQEKKQAAKKEQDKKLNQFKAGNKIGLSGRDMFTFNPELANEMSAYDEGDEYVSYSRDDSNEDEDEEEQDEIIVTNDLSDMNYYNEYFQLDDADDDAVVPNIKKLNIEEPGTSNAAAVPIDEDLFNDDELFDDDDDD